MAPLVSIVIPTFNRARDLERALNSVRAQSYADWEALVVDNHSTDGTAALIEAMAEPRISLSLIHNDGVIAASRNQGVRQASGVYLAFLDSDDWWEPKKLARSVAALEAGADIVYHDLYLARRPDQRQFRPSGTVRPVTAPVFADLLRSGNALSNSSVVVRLECLARVGPISENRDLIGMEDFDTWLKIARETDRFVMLPETLGYYWAGGGNMTNPDRTLRALKAFEIAYGGEPEFRSHSTGWFGYARSRALFRLGHYRQARAELRKLPIFRLPLGLALKSGYMWLRASAAR
ncbi:MAG: hypothetical protein JWR51_54 [Devosia sp.]|uniref:glycosyltransferase family 2 protein n=1 Tax=Devosia sp. TaxID=1871048 RepID=UPI00261D8F35|nr:glycosyltransferase [Devosia sp.]MDB5526951.1 hypothetical protein [Devosia sp.]